MKTSLQKVFFASTLTPILILGQLNIATIASAKLTKTKLWSANKAKEKTPLLKEPQEEFKVTAEQNKLTQAAQAYQNKPDDSTYNALWENFVTFTEQVTAKHKDPVHLFRSWKVLSDAGLKIVDAGGSNTSHIYSFNHIALSNGSFIPQAKSALIQWSDQKAVLPAVTSSSGHLGRHKKTRAKVIKTTAIIKTQLINIPSYVELKEATLLQRNASPVKTKGKKSTAPAVGRYLALSGVDIQSGHTWLLGLQSTSSNWVHYPELFQDVPPFLVQSASAKTKISSNALVITIGGPGGYDLVMPWVDGHFAFSTREAQDSANAVAHQFLLALQYKRPDLAKVWLADPKLVSIPAYLGLFNRSADAAALKLIGMSPPLNGGSRFRLITNSKDDLIIDVAKIKTQLLIRGIYIAPALIRSTTSTSLLVTPASTANRLGLKTKQIETQ